jgi:hypothetical protein
MSPYISAREHTRQPGGHADARLSVNRESCNLSPSRTNLPSHLRRAVRSVQSSTRGCSSGRPFRRSQRFRRLHCKTCDRPRLIHFNPISVHDVFPRSVGSGMFAFDWIGPSIHSHRTLVRFTSAPLMPVLENDEQPEGRERTPRPWHTSDRVAYCPGRRSACCSHARP